MKARHAQGLQTYGVPLQPFNGRGALLDALDECLDQAAYLRQEIMERDFKEGYIEYLERENERLKQQLEGHEFLEERVQVLEVANARLILELEERDYLGGQKARVEEVL